MRVLLDLLVLCHHQRLVMSRGRHDDLVGGIAAEGLRQLAIWPCQVAMEMVSMDDELRLLQAAVYAEIKKPKKGR